jgi:glutathione peroxidase
MKKNIILSLITMIFISCQNQAQNKTQTLSVNKETKMRPTIYKYKVEDINGKTFDFSDYKGYKIMVVNTASKCGLTPQYKELEELYEQYKDNKFIIVGFPANNFASQEPGTNEDIATFCTKNYGVTFPMMSKVSVKGNDMCEVYQFLTQKSKNELEDSDVAWNFQKYLINENGELEKVISPQTTPMSKEVLTWVMK